MFEAQADNSPAYSFSFHAGRTVSAATLLFGGMTVVATVGVTLASGATLHYAGHRRGLHVLIGEVETGGEGLAHSYCSSGAGEGWRVPGLVEGFGLLLDSERVAVGRPTFGTLSAEVSGAAALPGWTGLEVAQTVLLSPFRGGAARGAAVTGRIAVDAYASHQGVAAGAVDSSGWGFFEDEGAAPVCVLPSSEGYESPPDVLGRLPSGVGLEFPVSDERDLRSAELLTVEAEFCRYSNGGATLCVAADLEMTPEVEGLALRESDGVGVVVGDSRALENERVEITMHAAAALGDSHSQSYLFVRPSGLTRFAGLWAVPGDDVVLENVSGRLGVRRR